MPDQPISLDEAVALLGQGQILPRSADTLAQTSLAAGAAAVPQPQRLATQTTGKEEAEATRLRELGAQTGTPFHEEGLPGWMDLMVKMRENKEDQMRYLISKVGAENVRLNELGEPVVRITDPKTGKKEDFPVNPHAVTLDSLTGLASTLPEVATSALALRFGGKLPLGKLSGGLLERAGLGAAGAEIGRIGKTRWTEAADQAPERDLGQIIGEQTPMTVADFAANLGLGYATKLGQTIGRVAAGKGLPNPIAKFPMMQPADPEFTQAGVTAAKRLQAASGIDPELTVAETTGIPAIAQTEAQMLQKPAGATAMKQQVIREEQANKAIQNWIVDPNTLGTDEEVGRQGLSILSKPVMDLKQKVATATENAKTAFETARNQEIANQQLALIGASDIERLAKEGVMKSEMGNALKTRAVQDLNVSEAKVKALYDQMDSNPLTRRRVIYQGGPLKKDLQDAIKNLPAVEKQVQTPIIGPSGQLVGPKLTPLTITQTKLVPIETPVRPRLEELLEKISGGNLSLQDLKQTRTDVGNAINYSEVVMKTKDNRLNRLYKSLSEAIEGKGGALEQLKDPGLTQAWHDASTAFKAHADKFTDQSVYPLFREITDAGAQNNADIAQRIINKPDAYTAAQAFFGAGSKEMDAFRKIAVEDVFEQSLGASRTLDGQKLVNELRQMRTRNRALFQDAFGGKGEQMLANADVLSKTQNLPMDKLQDLLESKYPVTRKAIAELRGYEQRLGELYQNRIVKKFLSGDMEAAALNPDDFIRYLPQGKLSDVRAVMDIIRTSDPAVAEQIERKTIQTLLNQSKRIGTPRDVLLKSQGQPGDLISAPGLENALSTGDLRKKYELLLGNRLPLLRDYIQMSLLGEEKRRVGAGTGMFTKGQDITAMVNAIEGLILPIPGQKKSNMLAEIGSLARTKIFSVILASKPLSNWLLRPEALKDMPRTIKTLMASEPFIRGMIQEFGPAAAYKISAALRGGQAEKERLQTEDGLKPINPDEARRLLETQPQPFPRP